MLRCCCGVVNLKKIKKKGKVMTDGICEINKKLGIPNYLCIEKLYNTKTKSTKIIDMIPRKRGENNVK